MDFGTRIVIVGPSGSGKTTMARALGEALRLEVLGLDRVHWTGKVGSQRNEDEARGLVADFAARPAWIIEGVYGWLAAPAIPFASSLVWLDLPWSICREGLQNRGPWSGATAEEHAAFLEWAEAYWDRQSSCSFEEHQAMFARFQGTKLHLQSRAAIAEHTFQQDLRSLPAS